MAGERVQLRPPSEVTKTVLTFAEMTSQARSAPRANKMAPVVGVSNDRAAAGVMSVQVRPPSAVRAGATVAEPSSPGSASSGEPTRCGARPSAVTRTTRALQVTSREGGGAGGRQPSCPQATRSTRVSASFPVASQTVWPAAAMALG